MLLDPLRIPEDAWSHGEVLTALAARDIGALFRLIAILTGASQSRIGAAVGLEQGYVSRIMAGRKVTSRIRPSCGCGSRRGRSSCRSWPSTPRSVP